jgi:hypothetical protein
MFSAHVWSLRGLRRVKAATRHTRHFAAVLLRVLKTALHRISARPDYRRWGDPKSLEIWWDARTELLARQVPAGSRVLEFGAGRRQLERFLPSNCAYLASDLIDRGPGTILCDLNRRPLPDLRYLQVNVVVFGGVLEYLVDVPSLALWLAELTPTVITSYDCVKSKSMTWGWIIELLRRTQLGYMSNYTLGELTGTFERAGFHCIKTEMWEKQHLLVLEQSHTHAS